MSARRVVLTAALLAALAAGTGAVAALTLPVVFWDDTCIYLAMTRSFAPGPAKPVDLHAPLGYPIFLDLCAAAGGRLHLPLTAMLAQHLFSAATVPLLFLLGVRLGRPKSGLAAAAAYAVYLPRAFYAQALLSETLFTFFTVAFLAAFAGALKRRTVRDFALAGSLAAAAAAVRPGGVLLAVCAALFAARKPRQAAAAVLPLLAVWGAVALGNGAQHGRFAVIESSGRHLANQVYSKTSPAPGDPGAGRIEAELAKNRLPHRFPGYWWEYWEALRDGKTTAEADRFLFRAALADIRRHPSAYAERTISNAWQDLAGGRHAWLGGQPIEDYLRAGSGPAPKLLPERRCEEVVRSIELYDAPRRLGRFGDGWLRFWNAKFLRGRGGAAAILYLCGFGWAVAAGGRWRALAATAAVLLAATAGTEIASARYFEPLVPLGLLMLAAAAGAAVQTFRTIFPKF